MEYPELRQQMVAVGQLLYQRGWVPAYDGNFSVALDETWLLTTPAGRCKGLLDPAELIVVDRDGAPRDPTAAPPSTELLMHLAVYRTRPDVLACVHAHPPLAIACTVAGVSLEPAVLPEIILTLGKIPTVPYAMTGTPALGAAIEPFIAHHDAVLLDHHGTLTVGKTLLEAFHRTEQIEQAANIFFNAHQLGAIRRLGRQDIADLLAVRRSRGGDQAAEPAR
ncbi:MAG: class II aldolase/adducin family protein [Herpetosiphonaceae bacterium]|nr:class II aldolase/adducin family protein [Herpetosiphonaceae bacterium]